MTKILLSLAVLAGSTGAFVDHLGPASQTVGTALRVPLTVRPVEPDAISGLSAIRNDVVLIRKDAAALIQTHQEATSLISLALVYGEADDSKGPRREPGALERAIAIPIEMVADGIASRRGQQTTALPDPRFSPQELREIEAKNGRKRAATSVQIANRSGSCAGPMVDLLTRMEATGAGSSAAAVTTSLPGFARQVRRDLGRTIFPPDRSCQ